MDQGTTMSFDDSDLKNDTTSRGIASTAAMALRAHSLVDEIEGAVDHHDPGRVLAIHDMGQHRSSSVGGWASGLKGRRRASGPGQVALDGNGRQTDVVSGLSTA